jgi:hypothetical protein
MWRKTENSDDKKPLEKETSGDHVILRKDFKLIPETEEVPAHYEYEEWQMSAAQYEIYRNFETLMDEQSEALVELAGIISEVM